MDAPGKPPVTPELEDLYPRFEKELLVPLWTEIGDLMPPDPRSKAAPHRWEWRTLLELAGRAGDLVPVGRGGERRAIALANPSLGGKPYVEPGHAVVRYTNPTDGGDVLPTIRTQFHRIASGARDGPATGDRLVGLPGLRRLRPGHGGCLQLVGEPR